MDPKTVQRWLGGRMPHPRHRWKICDLLGQSEQYIWPQIILGVAGVLQTSEIVSAYAHRADAPSQLWAGMLEAARANIDSLGYSMSFFPEQHSGLAQILDEKCARGLRMRIALADPESAEVAARDNLERLGERFRVGFVHQLFTSNLCSQTLVSRYDSMISRSIMRSTVLTTRCLLHLISTGFADSSIPCFI